MVSRPVQRMIMLLMFAGGPIIGWLVNGDRGIMFGFAVSVLAIVWFLLERRRIV
jgi:hypothetical protein